MKLASLKSGRDGRFVVVNKTMNRYVFVTEEVRMLEIIADGLQRTEFVKCGDCVSIEILDSKGQPVFSEIKQQVQPYRN
ncbi:MAG: hypothetical protein VYD06_04085 [SAR324 cluster bacterium]|nr:hypothetical protein [SAR324 cluster bacterium]